MKNKKLDTASDFDKKAREIVDNWTGPYYDGPDDALESAISSALSQAYEEGRKSRRTQDIELIQGLKLVTVSDPIAAAANGALDQAIETIRLCPTATIRKENLSCQADESAKGEGSSAAPLQSGDSGDSADPYECSVLREEIATVVELVAKDGLPQPRDLDVALDAIICSVKIWFEDVCSASQHFSGRCPTEPPSSSTDERTE